MILCGVAAILLLAGMILLRKKPIWQKIRAPCMVLLAFSVMGFLAAAAESSGADAVSMGKIMRKEPGEGSLETEAYFHLEAEDTEYPITLTIEERTYRKSEEEALLAAAVKEIDETFCGTNDSREQMLSDPVVLEEYQQGAVMAEWMFSERDLISSEGEIFWEALKKSRQEITAFVALSCGESEELYSFSFQVDARAKSRQERAVLAIQEQIAAQETTEAVVTLPDTVDGQAIAWRSAPSVQAAELLGLGVLAAAAAAYAAKEQKEKQRQKRKQSLKLSYPEFVSKLSLLLGAGMTISGGLRKMSQMYQKRKAETGKEEAAYEELNKMICEMENGMSELRACQEFSERCDLQPYRKLVSLLISGQKAGNRRLMEQLNEEADRVFTERKHAAKKLGEEAGTKMLIPMMMMLVIVMAIVIIPAFLSFYGK